MRILEIGAATGRYSHALAQKGYCVDAVELIEHNIEIFKQNTTPGETVTITQGNATDLSMFEDDIYDITLLLGPMYHLFTTEDKRKALTLSPIRGIFLSFTEKKILINSASDLM